MSDTPTQAVPARPRLTWISVLNVCACICVCILHCSNEFFDGPSGHLWYPTAVVHATFYWPVPVFLMISGATLMTYRERMDTREYFIRRWNRVGIPFLFWSVFAVVFWYLVRINNGSNWQVFDLATILVAIERGTTNIYYWFFPALFSAYLLIVLLSAIEEPLRTRLLGWAALLGIIFELFNQSILPLMGFGRTTWWQFPIVGLMIYPVIGYLCAKIDFTRKQRIGIYALGCAGWLVHLWSLVVLSTAKGHVQDYFSAYDNVCAITQAAAVFVAFRYIPWERVSERFPKFDAIVNWLSGCSFGVYLIQYYVMIVIGDVLPGVFVGWRLIVLGFIPTYLLSLGLVALIKRIPVLRRVV